MDSNILLGKNPISSFNRQIRDIKNHHYFSFAVKYVCLRDYLRQFWDI